MQPRFNHDFTRLVYLGSEKPFLAHSGNYQLKALEWPSLSPSMLIDLVPEITRDDFAGLYGYNHSFQQSGFINDSKFYLFTSWYKGHERVYVLDTVSKEIQMVSIR